MVNEVKKSLNIRTKELREVLEKSFQEEQVKYNKIHPSYNSLNNRNDNENLFITCYVEKNAPYGIHIDNRLEVEKWVIDIVIMKPKLRDKIIEILKNNGFDVTEYHGECNGEFDGHLKLMELSRDTTYDDIKDINLKLLKIL